MDIIQQQKECLECKDDYINHSLNRFSNKINIYVKHLGFCNIGCYDEYSVKHYDLMRKLKREKLIQSIQKVNNPLNYNKK